MKVGNHGNPTLVAIQYTHWHTHYIDSKFLYNIHTNNCPQCFDFTDFVDFLLKIGNFLFTGCQGKLKKIVRFKIFYFNFMNSFKPKLHLYIIKFACPCVGFLSKSIFKMCSKALNIPYIQPDSSHMIWLIGIARVKLCWASNFIPNWFCIMNNAPEHDSKVLYKIIGGGVLGKRNIKYRVDTE